MYRIEHVSIFSDHCCILKHSVASRLLLNYLPEYDACGDRHM